MHAFGCIHAILYPFKRHPRVLSKHAVFKQNKTPLQAENELQSKIDILNPKNQ